MFCKAKSAKKNFFFSRRFLTILKQKCSNLRPLLSTTFPQGFWISKNIGHPTSGSGAKRRLNDTSKVNTQTNTQTDISTYRKHRPRGPMLWKRQPQKVRVLAWPLPSGKPWSWCHPNNPIIYLPKGVWDKWPKSKYQNFKSTHWFSYKIWTKNS